MDRILPSENIGKTSRALAVSPQLTAIFSLRYDVLYVGKYFLYFHNTKSSRLDPACQISLDRHNPHNAHETHVNITNITPYWGLVRL